MVVRIRPTARLYYSILFVAIAVLTYNDAVQTDSNPVVTGSSFSRRIFDEASNVAQPKRTLRATVDEENSGYEDRGLDGLKKFTETAKLKLAKNNQPATDKLFAKLKVGSVETNLFETAPFQKWAKLVTNAYEKTPDAGYAAMVATMIGRYGDDALAKILVEAQQGSATKTLAATLQEMLLKNWLTRGKDSDDAFKLLQLQKEGGNLLKSPMLSTRVSYVEMLHQNLYKILFVKLTGRYGDEGLSAVLNAARTASVTKSVAAELEMVQRAHWRRSGKSVNDIFTILKLNQGGDNLLKNPLLRTWVGYVVSVNKNPYKLLYLALERNLDVAGIAREGDKIFENPVWTVWVSYLIKPDSNPYELMYSTLRAKYSDARLEAIIARAKIIESTERVATRLEPYVWRGSGKTSDDIFKLLKLDTQGEKLFESPAFSTWTYYVEQLNKFKQHADRFAVITELEKRYGKLPLMKMLYRSAMRAGNQGTKEVITRLQTSQAKKWGGECLTGHRWVWSHSGPYTEHCAPYPVESRISLQDGKHNSDSQVAAVRTPKLQPRYALGT